MNASRIQHNIASMNSYRNYTSNSNKLGSNLEKLSSGYKINRAGDDAAGLAISEKMRAQITGLEVAQKNAKDGISVVQTAEGALTEVHDMLNRMYSLAEQSANGIYTKTERQKLQDEVDALTGEIDRISKATNFNGIALLNGDLAGLSTENEAKAPSATNNYATLDLESIGKGTIAASGTEAGTTFSNGVTLSVDKFYAGDPATVKATGTLTQVEGVAATAKVGFTFGNVFGTGQGFGDISTSNTFVKNISINGANVAITIAKDTDVSGDNAKTELVKAINAGIAKALGGENSQFDIKQVTADMLASTIATFDLALTARVGEELSDAEINTALSGVGIANSTDMGGIGADAYVDVKFGNDTSAAFSIAGEVADVDATALMTALNTKDASLDGLRTAATMSAGAVINGTNFTIAYTTDADGPLSTEAETKVKALQTAFSTNVSTAVAYSTSTAGNADLKVKIGDGEFTASSVDLSDTTNAVVFKDDAGNSLKLTLGASAATINSTNYSTVKAEIGTVDSTNVDKSLVLQIGDDNQSHNQLRVAITSMSSGNLFRDNDGNPVTANTQAKDGNGNIVTRYVDIMDEAKANTAMSTIKNAIERVSVTRGNLGAIQNRLEHTINNLGTTRENLQDAESSIRDTDVAEEMMKYTKNSIMNQAAQAMLAQANQLPQGVLQLLQ